MAVTSRRTTGAKSSSVKSIKAKIPDDWEKTLQEAVVLHKDKRIGLRWTDQQIITLKKYYGKVPHPVLAKTMGVTVGRLKYKVEKLVARGEMDSCKRAEI